MKPIEDRGHSLQVMKPLRLPRYEASKLPDPGQCVDALIVVNDRKDGVPRARLMLSNGASWDEVALSVSLEKQVTVSPIDLTPIVRTAVAELLPSVAVTREVRTIPAPALTVQPSAVSQEDYKAIAAALLEMSDAITNLTRYNHDLQQRVAFLENNALARAQLIREAS